MSPSSPTYIYIYIYIFNNKILLCKLVYIYVRKLYAIIITYKINKTNLREKKRKRNE